jgi:hypothetical protein
MHPDGDRTMIVELALPLFGKPGWELGEGEEVMPRDLRDLAEDLRGRLMEAADIVEKLTGAGWDARMTLYDVCLSHPYISTAAQAEKMLLDLGIDPKLVAIDEWEGEDEEEEEEATPADAAEQPENDGAA